MKILPLFAHRMGELGGSLILEALAKIEQGNCSRDSRKTMSRDLLSADDQRR